jgi:hypothetical protein
MSRQVDFTDVAELILDNLRWPYELSNALRRVCIGWKDAHDERLTVLSASFGVDRNKQEQEKLLSRFPALDSVLCYDASEYGMRCVGRITGLTDLSCFNGPIFNGVINLQPLVGLTALRTLYLECSPEVSDLQHLAHLTALEELELYDLYGVSDLGPLSGLTKLDLLTVTGSPTLDLLPLSNLTNLALLHLSCAFITDLRPLSSLTRLFKLSFDGCLKLSDLRPLSGLPDLTELKVDQCDMTDRQIEGGVTLEDLLAA